jgi:hypothetical protein
MKKIFVLLFFMLVGASLSAQSLSEMEASKLAQKFLKQFSGHAISSINIQQVYKYKYKGQSTFYIVNLSNPKATVLVTAEKASFPVLGYIPGFHINQNQKLPINLRNLLSDYARQTLDIQKRQLASTTSIKKRWLELESSSKGPSGNVNPLLTTIWSQGCYFNDSTPSDPGGPCGHAVTGCVATAMGQVLNYHKFPPTGSGIRSYQSSYGKLTANFGATNYSWNLMADTLDSNTPSASVAAVSQLLGHCGVAVDMMYSGGASGAYSEDALKAIVHYFNYNTASQMLYRDNYTDSVWELMVMEELDSLRPLYYDGSGTGGHAFVCDGYQNNMFHFNWGWNGSHNGWFLVSNLNPGGMNFGQYNAAFFGIKPQLPGACNSTTDTLYAASGSLNDGSSYQDYQANSNCSWLIAPAGAQSLSFEFHSFELATDDTLYIYDGLSPSAPLLHSFTGDSLPAAFASSGGSVFVLFKSNNTNQDAGWSLSYKSEFCQGNVVLNSPYGQISDGSGAFLYNNNTSCSWLISPPGNAPIHLEFLHFKTEASYDYVYVYDGVDASAPLLATLDGHTLPSKLIAQSGQMFVRFTSDGGVVDEGWTAAIELVIIWSKFSCPWALSFAKEIAF